MSITADRIATRTPLFVYAGDPVSQAGLVAQLRLRPELYVVEETDIDRAKVAVLSFDRLDEAAIAVIRATQRDGVPKVVVVAGEIDETSILTAVEAGACGFVRRREASPERLSDVVRRAERGDGSVPEDLIGSLLQRAGRGGPEVGPVLDEREVTVLTLVAEGLDTIEIAQRMCYSERTIKNVLHDVTSRLGLRNRSHAVAHAIRQGWI